MQKSFSLLKQLVEDIEGTILTSEESLLIGGQGSDSFTGNNCVCNGNNCNCYTGNDCKCNGNNCSCNNLPPDKFDPDPGHSHP